MTEISKKCLRNPGDNLGVYTVVKKIGKGGLSTVYRCELGGGGGSGGASGDSGGSGKNTSGGLDSQGIAVKSYDHDLEKYYRNEVCVLRRIGEGSPHVVAMISTFAHVAEDTSAIYPCITMELRGDSVLKLMNYCKEAIGGGLPMSMVLRVASDVFRGLAFLHGLGIIHGDIKPENLLLDRVVDEDLTAEDIHVKIIDVGSSSFVDKIFSPNIGTDGYIAPEIIVGAPFGTPADIWSAFTVCFDLIAGASLFDVFFECDINYGDIDETTVGMDVSEIYTPCTACVGADPVKYSSCECGHCDTCSTHEKCLVESDTDDTSSSGSASSASSSSDDSIEHKYARNYCYLLLVAKVIGYPPAEFTDRARSYYNRKGRLINNPDIVPTTISQLLDDNYDMDADLCKRVEDFLLRGLRYDPDDRITAMDALEHPFML